MSRLARLWLGLAGLVVVFVVNGAVLVALVAAAVR